jgi:hypothetical protein
MNDLSTLSLMRIVYLLNFLLLGLDVWPSIVRHVGAWEPMRGVAFSFWAALATLSGLGLRYPVKMLPLLLLQFLYKLIWLFAVAVPNWSAVRATDLFNAMALGILVDLIAIPWPHVLATFCWMPGDRWTRQRGMVVH